MYILGLCQQQQQQFSQNDACQVKSGLLPHETYCDKYYSCLQGQSLLRDCPNGLVFIGRGRGLLAPCGYPHNDECFDRPNRSMD